MRPWLWCSRATLYSWKASTAWRSRPKISKKSSRKLFASASSRWSPCHFLAKARARDRICSRVSVKTGAAVMAESYPMQNLGSKQFQCVAYNFFRACAFSSVLSVLCSLVCLSLPVAEGDQCQHSITQHLRLWRKTVLLRRLFPLC